jgi:hypothetical protein
MIKSVIQVPSLTAAKKGDIGLEWGTTLVSRLIERGEAVGDHVTNPPSHAFIFAARNVILEARWPRVALKSVVEYAHVETEIYRIIGPTDAEISAAFDRVLQTYINHMYGLTAVWAMAFIEPMRRLGIMLPNLLADFDNVFCSELAAVDINMLDTSAPRPLRPADVDPANLRAWLRAKLS